MSISRMIQARVPGEIQDIANQAIPPTLFQPNAETLAAVAGIGPGGLKRFDSVDVLSEDLPAGD